MTWPKSRVPVQINNWSVTRNHTARVIRSCTLSWSPSLKARVKSGLVFVTTWRISTVNFWQVFTPLSFLLLNIAWTWLWLLSSIYLNSQFYSREVLREGNVMSPKNKNETTAPHFLYVLLLWELVAHVYDKSSLHLCFNGADKSMLASCAPSCQLTYGLSAFLLAY